MFYFQSGRANPAEPVFELRPADCVQRENSRGDFQKNKMQRKPRKSQTVI